MPLSKNYKPLNSRRLVVIAVVLVAGPTLAYYANFHDWPIAKNTEEWSRFGGYLGGVVAPLLSFASLVVLAQATYDFRERDKSEREALRREDREYQEKHLELQRHYERTKLIFELESKWEDMIEDRDRAADFIKANPYTDIRRIERENIRGREVVYKTLGFFRTLEFAISEKVISEKHAIDLFGPVYVWWYIVGARCDYPSEWDAGRKLESLFNRMHANSLFPEWEKYAEDELRDKYSGPPQQEPAP
jgi:hypothetical protein